MNSPTLLTAICIFVVAGCTTAKPLQITCALGSKCTASGTLHKETYTTPDQLDSQLIQVGVALDGDIPEHVHSEGHNKNGKHCWIQLPGGQWQMYHC